MNLQLVERVTEIQDFQRKSLKLPVNELKQFKYIVLWGAGVSGRTCIRSNPDVTFNFVLDSRPEKQCEKFFGLEVKSPTAILELNASETVIVLATEIHSELVPLIKKLGNYAHIVPNRYSSPGIFLSTAFKNQLEIFHWLNSKQLNYVYDRIPPSKLTSETELDIIVDETTLTNLVFDQKFSKDKDRSSFFLDVVWSEPIGVENELPYYPSWIGKKMLNTARFCDNRKIYMLSDEMMLMAIVYQIVIHLGTQDAINKYENAREQFKNEFNLDFCMLTLPILWDWLVSSPYYPGIDFIRKWASHNQSNFLKEKCLFDYNGQSPICVFLIRECVVIDQKLFQDLKRKILTSGYEVLSFGKLGLSQKAVKERMRSGVWLECPSSRAGGLPQAFMILKGNNYKHFQNLKNECRQFIDSRLGFETNAIHSSDDRIEASEYLEVIGQKQVASKYLNL